MATPQMAGGLVEAALLSALVVATRAQRVLEIGTFTGVSALTMAARLDGNAELVTLEADPAHAAVARRHFAASPHGHRVRLIEGDALSTLADLDGPFDVVFIDAWKPDYPAYLEAVLPKLASHGVIVADNLFLGGAVLDPAATLPGAVTLRSFASAVRDDSRLESALLSVGDGILLIWHAPGPVGRRSSIR